MPDIQTIVMTVPALVIGLTFHEFAHAWTASKFGDDTALRLGRVTLNPLRHLDLVGSLMLLVVGFGWAKPVPVDVDRLRPRVWGDVAVSLAGVVMNYLIAVVFMLLVALSMQGFFVGYFNDVLMETLYRVARINLLLIAFNLIPIPPLDGFRAARYLLPASLQGTVDSLYRFGPLLLILLLMSGRVGDYLLPATDYLTRSVIWLIQPLLP